MTAMHDENVHARCQWCGICLTCQKPTADMSKCGNAWKPCKRHERFERLRKAQEAKDKDSQ